MAEHFSKAIKKDYQKYLKKDVGRHSELPKKDRFMNSKDMESFSKDSARSKVSSPSKCFSKGNQRKQISLFKSLSSNELRSSTKAANSKYLGKGITYKYYQSKGFYRNMLHSHSVSTISNLSKSRDNSTAHHMKNKSITKGNPISLSHNQSPTV